MYEPIFLLLTFLLLILLYAAESDILFFVAYSFTGMYFILICFKRTTKIV